MKAKLIYQVADAVSEKNFTGARISAQLWADGRGEIIIYNVSDTKVTLFLANSVSSIQVTEE